MIGESLSLENLREIKDSMAKIAPIDRSANFTLYYNEVLERFDEAEKAIRYNKSQLKENEEERVICPQCGVNSVKGIVCWKKMDDCYYSDVKSRHPTR